MISEEISNQVSRKLNEIRNNLNSQIHEAINSVMTETVLPSIQNTLGTHGNMNYITLDQASVGPHKSQSSTNFISRDRKSNERQRNSEVENAQNHGKIILGSVLSRKTTNKCPVKAQLTL